MHGNPDRISRSSRLRLSTPPPASQTLLSVPPHGRGRRSLLPLQLVPEEIFGQRTLGDIHALDSFGQSGKEVMICSFDLNPDTDADRNRNYRPVIFHSAFERDRMESLVDIALRTTSAPTYFPIYQQKYIDGGVAMNNPAMAAIAYAMNNSPAVGDEEGQYLSDGYKDPLTESNIQSTIYYARHVLPDGNFLRIDPFFDDAEINDPVLLKKSKIPMDMKDEKTLQALLNFTERTFLRHKGLIQEFLKD